MSGHLKAPPLYYNIIIHKGNRQDKKQVRRYEIQKQSAGLPVGEKYKIQDIFSI
jgi:hypothetical protein